MKLFITKNLLAYATARAAKTSVKKWTRAFSNFFNLIPFHLICQMLGNFSEVNSKGRKRKLFSCVHVPHKTCNYTVSRCSRTTTKKKCAKTQSMVHVQSCCFPNLNRMFFCRSRCRPRRRCLSSLILQTLWRQRPKEHFYSRHWPRPCFNIESYQGRVLSLIPPQETQQISLRNYYDVTNENITENREKISFAVKTILSWPRF